MNNNNLRNLRNIKIVCIGGGTGLHAELSGLKEAFPAAELSAVVTMMDSGSNSGKLRDEFGYLPPGDIRQCLVALSDAPIELRALMQHRFYEQKSDLHGHVIGNILLTALKQINGGDEYAAIESMAKILHLHGSVYPVTLTNAHIVATIADGTIIKGEGNLYERNNDIPIKDISLEPKATIFERTREIICEADIIIIGPGGLHHSILPNLKVEGMREALYDAQQRGAKVLLVTNTMTKYGDSTTFKASDFVVRVQKELGNVILNAVIANNGIVPEDKLSAYAAERAEPVVMDLKETKNSPLIIAENFVNNQAFFKHGKPSFARHDPAALAHAITIAIERLLPDSQFNK